MNSIDKANTLLYNTLMDLVDLNTQDLSLTQKNELSDIIDNLEEVRHLLYELKNEINTTVS